MRNPRVLATFVSCLLAAACDPHSPSPQYQPQAEWCEEACERRASLTECPRRKAVPLDRCVSRCEELEAIKPGVTGAKCVSEAADCAALGKCAPE